MCVLEIAREIVGHYRTWVEPYLNDSTDQKPLSLTAVRAQDEAVRGFSGLPTGVRCRPRPDLGHLRGTGEIPAARDQPRDLRHPHQVTLCLWGRRVGVVAYQACEAPQCGQVTVVDTEASNT